MTDPLQYLDQLEGAQTRLEHSLDEVESRLGDTRLARVAPVPLGDTGDRAVLAPPVVESARPIEVDRPPDVAGDVEDGVRRLLAVGGPGARAAPEPVKSSEGEPEHPDDEEHSGAPAADETGTADSTVELPVKVGRAWSIHRLARARIRLPETGPGSAAELFRGFDPSRILGHEVEVTLLRVEGSGVGEEEGLDVGPIVPSLVARGWVFRALPWTREVRGSLVASLDLPQSLAGIPPNPEDRADDARLLDGDAFVLIAVDPDAVGAQPGDRDEGDAHVPTPEPRPHGSKSEESGAEATSDLEAAAGESERPGRGVSSAVELMRKVWDEHVGGGEPSFGAFIEALARFEEQTAGDVSAELRGLVDAFTAWLRRGDAGAAASEHAPPAQPGEAEVVARLERGPYSARFDPRQLRRKYKHAPDFGVHERYGEPGLARLQEALSRHLAEVADRYLVLWRGRRLVTHVGRGRIVWTTGDREFITGYRASPEQLHHVWSQPERVEE